MPLFISAQQYLVLLCTVCTVYIHCMYCMYICIVCVRNTQEIYVHCCIVSADLNLYTYTYVCDRICKKDPFDNLSYAAAHVPTQCFFLVMPNFGIPVSLENKPNELINSTMMYCMYACRCIGLTNNVIVRTTSCLRNTCWWAEPSQEAMRK